MFSSFDRMAAVWRALVYGELRIRSASFNRGSFAVSLICWIPVSVRFARFTPKS